jgi:hypothetical protein
MYDETQGIKEIDRQINVLEKMMGRNMEYDKGILEGIFALEHVKEILDDKISL